ncbi:hypothetical protein EYF80_046184 [Liparis tanakae]|uniref:Uncharacterized protein n=1 Tax=Liparis tanakae TaxID=230148 RepID=A0A4Z2FRS6_9TELE|nr:hypothetical protein EYF80_046184 [Liparis tanakae]
MLVFPVDESGTGVLLENVFVCCSGGRQSDPARFWFWFCRASLPSRGCRNTAWAYSSMVFSPRFSDSGLPQLKLFTVAQHQPSARGQLGTARAADASMPTVRQQPIRSSSNLMDGNSDQ